jgi:hypothetical protein
MGFIVLKNGSKVRVLSEDELADLERLGEERMNSRGIDLLLDAIAELRARKEVDPYEKMERVRSLGLEAVNIAAKTLNNLDRNATIKEQRLAQIAREIAKANESKL